MKARSSRTERYLTHCVCCEENVLVSKQITDIHELTKIITPDIMLIFVFLSLPYSFSTGKNYKLKRLPCCVCVCVFPAFYFRRTAHTNI
jgi:hypothetical protein